MAMCMAARWFCDMRLLTPPPIWRVPTRDHCCCCTRMYRLFQEPSPKSTAVYSPGGSKHVIPPPSPITNAVFDVATLFFSKSTIRQSKIFDPKHHRKNAARFWGFTMECGGCIPSCSCFFRPPLHDFSPCTACERAPCPIHGANSRRNG